MIESDDMWARIFGGQLSIRHSHSQTGFMVQEGTTDSY